MIRLLLTLTVLLLPATPARGQAPDTLHPDTLHGGTLHPGTLPDTLHIEAVTPLTFRAASAVAVDPLGTIYVADAGAHVVLKLSPMGNILSSLGGPGSNEGEFDDPQDIDPTTGLVLLIADAGNRRIQRFSRNDAYLGSISMEAADDPVRRSVSSTTYRRESAANESAVGRPVSVASSRSNETYAIDGDRAVVLKWDEKRRLVQEIGGSDGGAGVLTEPVALAVGSGDLLYVADRRAGVVVFDTFGGYVRTIVRNRAHDLRGIAAAGGRLIVTLSDRILLFDDSGVLDHELVAPVEGDLVDAAPGPDGVVYLLTAKRLYRSAH